jgi:hypothetical protein
MRRDVRWVLLALAACIVALIGFRWGGSSAPVEHTAEKPPAIERVVRNLPVEPIAPRPPAPPADAVDPMATDLPLAPDPEALKSLGNVDLDEVRKALPDNSYWQLGAPTADEQLKEWRDGERDRWNVEYGKVLSGTATEEEIRAYYDYRAKVSGDYVEFASYLLDNYKDIISEQDQTLLHLAIRLHRARLEAIPRKVQEAIDRKHQQDEARAKWLADEAAFAGGDVDAE